MTIIVTETEFTFNVTNHLYVRQSRKEKSSRDLFYDIMTPKKRTFL